MKTIEWGFLIVNYLFLGGLSAGLFFISALAALIEKNNYSPHARIARYGALLAPWPVLLGCLLLIFDLGRWYRFYKLFLHFRWGSPMSIGSWTLLLFSAISLLFFYAWLPGERRQWLFSLVPKRLDFLHVLNCDLSGWRRGLALAGVPLSLSVGIYTGVLLGAVQSRPFWNTNLVAQMFLFSALSTGCAALILTLTLSRKKLESAEFRLLYTLDICFLTLEFFIVLPYIVHGELSMLAVRESLWLILGGPFTLVFWLVFLGLGLLIPLAIEVREMAPVLLATSRVTPGRAAGAKSVLVREGEASEPPAGEPDLDVTAADAHFGRALGAVTALLVLMGGFLLRYIFVFAGQMSRIK